VRASGPRERHAQALDADRPLIADVRDARDLVRGRGLPAADQDLVADLEARAVGRRLVERDLAGLVGRVAVDVGQRVEALLVRGEDDRRGPVAADPLALLVEDRDDRLEALLGRLDAGTASTFSSVPSGSGWSRPPKSPSTAAWRSR
jgi:hypothetical protein